MEWFECKVAYEKENEDGKIKKITENYLVDAISFTEAETITIEKVTDLIGGSFDVNAVKKEKIGEIFRSETGEGIWVKVKVEFITVDEISGKEKRTKVNMYQQTKDMFSVASDLKTNLKKSIVDWEIKSATETKILDVFEH
jgi:hypothetical protein